MQILLIEDDNDLSTSLALRLGKAGFDVVCAETGADGFAKAADGAYDLILLDLNLPDTSGYKVLVELRSNNIQTPILVLSGRQEPEIKVQALNAGADDYIEKPADPRELIARLHAIQKRERGERLRMVQIGKITVDLKSKAVTYGQASLPLTPFEFRLLEILSARKGLILSKTTAACLLYNSNRLDKAKIINVLICKLRKKLAAVNDGDHCIDTIWGCGYRLRDPLMTHPAIRTSARTRYE